MKKLFLFPLLFYTCFCFADLQKAYISKAHNFKPFLKTESPIVLFSTLKTHHFLFYFNFEDYGTAIKISKWFENDWDEICHILNIKSNFQMTVNIFPNQQHFHAFLKENIKDTDYPKSVIDYCGKEGFSIVSFARPNMTYLTNTIFKLAYSNFVNILIQQWREDYYLPTLPKYLCVGIGRYIADYFEEYKNNEEFKEYFNKNGLPSFEILSSKDYFDVFSENFGNEFSSAIVHFIVEKYGVETFSQIVHRDKISFDDLFFVSKEKFREKVEEFIRQQIK